MGARGKEGTFFLQSRNNLRLRVANTTGSATQSTCLIKQEWAIGKNVSNKAENKRKLSTVRVYIYKKNLRLKLL